MVLGERLEVLLQGALYFLSVLSRLHDTFVRTRVSSHPRTNIIPVAKLILQTMGMGPSKSAYQGSRARLTVWWLARARLLVLKFPITWTLTPDIRLD